MTTTTVIDDRPAAAVTARIRADNRRPPGREKAEFIGNLMLIPYIVLFTGNSGHLPISNRMISGTGRS